MTIDPTWPDPIKPVMVGGRQLADLDAAAALIDHAILFRRAVIGPKNDTVNAVIRDVTNLADSLLRGVRTTRAAAHDDVAELQDRLDVRCRRGGWDWDLKTDTAAQCAWAATLRITRDPNHHGRPDESHVIYQTGGADPAEVLTGVLAAGILWAAAQPPGPANPMRPCEWVHSHTGHGYTLAEPAELAGDWRCAGHGEEGSLPGGMLGAPLGQTIRDPEGAREHVTVLDVTWPDSDGLITYWTIEDGDQPQHITDGTPVTPYTAAGATRAGAGLALDVARQAWRDIFAAPTGSGGSEHWT